MSRYNRCNECGYKEGDYCNYYGCEIDYFRDTSECRGFEEREKVGTVK